MEQRRQGHESYERFIGTILNQIFPSIDEYPPNDKELLNEFISTIQRYREAEYNRTELEKNLEKFRDDILENKQYDNLPFLWFVGTFLRNAKLILSISEYHPVSYYKYITKHLRGNPKVLGIYQLVTKKTPLSDLSWEDLQYESNKLLYPLSNDQLQILKTIYSCIEEVGIYTLDPRKLKATISNQVSFPKNVKPSIQLKRFFSRLEGRWFLHFFSSAFGLERMFVQLQLLKSTSLEDIIDFQNTENTVLTYSDVYCARDLQNTFILYLLVPSQEVDQLEAYFRYCDEKEYLILKELTQLKTTSISASLQHYQVNSGWSELSPSKKRQLTSLLKAKFPRKKIMTDSTFFITPAFNSDWNFREHSLSTEIIKLYCRIPNEYQYQDLPFKPNNQDSDTLSRTEIGLLKQLHYNKVVHMGFVPWRLVFELSLDLYCIILPRIPFFQLKHFLQIIPYSEIYFSGSSTYLRAWLPPKLVHWIRNNLNWTVISIIRKHQRHDLDFNYFDSKKLQWKTPNVLKNKR